MRKILILAILFLFASCGRNLPPQQWSDNMLDGLPIAVAMGIIMFFLCQSIYFDRKYKEIEASGKQIKGKVEKIKYIRNKFFIKTGACNLRVSFEAPSGQKILTTLSILDDYRYSVEDEIDLLYLEKYPKLVIVEGVPSKAKLQIIAFVLMIAVIAVAMGFSAHNAFERHRRAQELQIFLEKLPNLLERIPYTPTPQTLTLSEQIMRGDISSIIESQRDDWFIESLGNMDESGEWYSRYEWVEFDITGDGTNELILQTRDGGKMRRIFAIFAFDFENQTTELVYLQTVELARFLFLSENGNLIWYHFSYGILNSNSWTLREFDDDWRTVQIKSLGTTWIYCLYDLPENWAYTNPDMTEVGVYFRLFADNGGVQISESRFRELFEEMTGFSFCYVQPDWFEFARKSELDRIFALYESVLRSEIPFYCEWRGATYLRDSSVHFGDGEAISIAPNDIAVADLNGDGIPEVVVCFFRSIDQQEIFTYYDGKIFSSTTSVRSMSGLKTDGTHYTSGGADTNAIRGINFNQGSIEYVDIYDFYISWDNDAGLVEYINGIEVSQEEFETVKSAAFAWFDAKEDVIFHPFRTENLAALWQCNSRYYAQIESGNNFRVSQIFEDSPWYSHYEIFDNNGEVVFSFVTDRPAWFTQICEDILQFSASAGTNVRWSKFYSAENNLLSDVFQNEVYVSTGNVAYIEWVTSTEWNVIVRDIFNAEGFRKEFPLETIAPGSRVTSSTVLNYLGDGKIEICFLAHEDVFDKSVILCIND